MEAKSGEKKKFFNELEIGVKDEAQSKTRGKIRNFGARCRGTQRRNRARW